MHFSVLVLTDAPEAQMAEEAACILLERYDENLEKEEYLANCHCVGSEAWMAGMRARQAKSEELGTKEMHSEMHLLHQEICRSTGGEGDDWLPGAGNLALVTDPLQREMLQSRMDELTRRIEQANEQADLCRREIESNHPLINTPDPNCESCCGTGLHFSTANPEGRWDWFSVGGRWTGLLDQDYEPGMDPRNFQPCDLCNQTGIRWWSSDGEMMRPASAPKSKDDEVPSGMEERTCNGCQGTGTSRRFHNASFDGDIKPVGQIYNLSEIGSCLAALITPDGEWHDSDSYGAGWQDFLDCTLGKDKGRFAVLVDCHC